MEIKKVCSKCKKEKEIAEFGKCKNNKDGLQFYCKLCRKEIDSERKEDFKQARIKRRNWFNSLKQNCTCEKCNDNRWYILDYHHLDPSKKDFTIGSFWRDGINKMKIIEEIKKCILLCRNCHSEFHYLEKINNITIKEYLEL